MLYAWLILQVFVVENAKIFRSSVKSVWIFPSERSCRILIGLCKSVFMNHSFMFLDRGNKAKLKSISFSYFLELLWKENKFKLKKCDNVFNLSIIKKLIKLSCLHCSCKKVVEKLNKGNLKASSQVWDNFWQLKAL